MNKLMKFFKDEDGLETVEYAVMLAFIAVGLIFAITVLRNSVANKFSEAATKINNAS
jgi:Flp pilus assembly pilin Flp